MADEKNLSASSDKYTKWVAEIDAYESAFRNWEVRVKNITKRYRAAETAVRESFENAKPSYNILYANVSILQPAIYNQPPTPIVDRRNGDKDPVGRLASMILQRALQNCIEIEGIDEPIEQARDDRVLGGRGTLWERYEAGFGETLKTPEGADTLDAEGLPVQEVTYERSCTDYVAYNDFLHSVAKRWKDVWWVARRNAWTKKEVKEVLGQDIASKLKYSGSLDGKSQNNGTNKGGRGKPVAYVYEIWDRNDKKIRYLCKEHPEDLLKEVDYPYELQGGFPCPKPCFGIMTNDTLVPVPDYIMYQDQALDLDIIESRISMLTEACKAAAIVDQSLGITAQKLFQGDDLQVTQVKDLAAKYQAGGSAGLSAYMQFTPIEAFANVITLLQQQKQARLEDIYQITGLGDIVRGMTNPNETLGAQELKSGYANLRLKKIQRGFQAFVRDSLRLKAEIMCEQFSTESILELANVEEMRPDNMPPAGIDPQTGMPTPDMWQQALEQAVALLRDDRQRTIRVDIETDSTIGLIEQQDREAMNRFTATVSSLLQQAVPAMQQSPALAPFIKEVLMMNIRQFKIARQTEATLEEALDKLVQEVSQPKEPQPDPEMIKIQNEAKTAEQKLQLQAQKQQSEAQVKIQGQQVQAKTDLTIEQMKLAVQQQKDALDAQVRIMEINQREPAIN